LQVCGLFIEGVLLFLLLLTNQPSMKRLLTTHYSTGAFNLAMLLLRISSGALLMNHGYDKLVHFAAYRAKFIDFMGLGQSTSLALVIFAEFFCALFVIIGLFTRLSVIPIIVVMCVALFKLHNGNFMGTGEIDTLYLTAFTVLLFLGPGRISVDGLIGK
jgi:putative oxidoreductase